MVAANFWGAMLVGHYVVAAVMLDVAGCEVEPAFALRRP